ncbi:MAG: hypothetical protein ABL964_13820 [Steroidobacteraceae bacterium]
MLALLACVNTGAAEPEPNLNEKTVTASGKPLDLRTPDVTRLVTPEELEQLTRGTGAEEMEIDEVQVQRRSGLPPDRPPVWPGLLAPFWALAHPTQALRIFAPLPPDQVNSRNK